MPRKAWIAQYKGHEIRVVNSWTGGVHLLIDGIRRDSNRRLLVPRWTRCLSARLEHDDGASDLVEVYVVALFTVKAQIRINEQPYAGDLA